MKNTILITICSLLIFMTPSLYAQRELTLSESVLGMRRELAPERLTNLNWIPNTNTYTYLEKETDGESMIMVNTRDFSKVTLINTDMLNAQLPHKEPIIHLPQFSWISKTKAYFIYNKSIYTFNISNKTILKYCDLPHHGHHFSFRPRSADIAFTRGKNLFILINGVETAITSHTDPNITSGQTVSRVEFGINQGIIWSTDGNSLAFYEKDESHVSSYPLVDYGVRPAQLNAIPYPMIGMGSEEVKIGIYSLKQKSVVYLDSKNTKEGYLTSLSWGPKDQFVYAANLNRGQDTLILKQYNAKTGAWIKNILTETDEKYVHPTHGLQFIDKNTFLWQSENTGLNQFYLYHTNTQIHRKIVTDSILVNTYLGYDSSLQKIWFLGNQQNRIDQHLYEVTLTTQGNTVPTQITKGNGYTSWASLSSTHEFVLVKSSSLTTPNAYDLVDLSNHSISNLMTALNPLADLKIGETRLGTCSTTLDKTILHTRTILPYDFDENKKYPVLVYVYNGPGVQLIHSNWLASASLWMYYFANKGYIVYTIDGRGSANRGLDFEQKTFRKLGQIEMEDQLLGLKQLKSHPYVDSQRIGVYGWSYGGFMTTSLLTSYPGAFKVGVAGGPVMDWKYYEVMYGERYMDTPQTNAEGFELTSNLKRAKNLKDKLLIIHGTNDPTVVKQNSDLFLKACIDQGVSVDYFEYPGHPHNVRGKDRVHLMKKILSYIEDNL